MSHKFIPGFRGLDAKLFVSNNAAYVNFDDQDLVMSYPRVYAQDSLIHHLSADLFFNKSESGWALVANDVKLNLKKTHAVGSLALTSNQDMSSPLLDLAFDLEGGDLSDAQYYIPAKIMKPNAVEWIKKSLLGGDLKTAKIIHYGHVREYPYKENEGTFQVEIGLENGLLEFAETWPRIDSINGLFKLNSHSFQFYANKAKSLGNDLSEVLVEFPDFFADKVLHIAGDIKGGTGNKLHYLHESPLEDMFAAHIESLQAEGDSQLNLKLAIPLVDVKKTTINGLLKLSKNHLFSEQWKLDLTNLGGDFTFTEKSFKSKLVTGKIYDTAINGSIDTIDSGDGHQLQIRGLGLFSSAAIQKGINSYMSNAVWSKLLKGETQLRSTLTIPFKTNGDAGSKIKLQLGSDLRGMALDFPRPLGKKADDTVNFALDMDLSGAIRDIGLLYGDYNAILRARVSEKEFKVDRGGIGLMQTAKLPEEVGFNFTGRLPEFSWTEWSKFLFPENPQDSLFEKGGGASLFFDVSLDKAEVFNKEFENVRVHASQAVEYWSLRLSGPEIQGEIKVPLDPTRVPLSLNLNKLYVAKSLPGEEAGQLDPESFFNINANIKDLVYNKIKLGHLILKTSSIDGGKKIENMSLQPTGSKLDFAGKWMNLADGGQQTQLSVDLNATKFGKTLESWDFKDVMLGGKGNIKLDLNWKADPMDFDFKLLNGQIDVALEDASLLDFDIGAAKLFTVLLPRRLLLDFRDVARDGLYFDSINGRYNIQSGEAFTDNFLLKGPVADLKLAGKLGLADRTFDQVVTVNRRLLGDSIPLVGTVITADPILSGSIFVIKKLFEKQIDDILSVQYTIEGSWGAPVIKPVESAPKASEQNDILSE
ncbi:MAG: DUF3971 domain-containing protein, partial [Gammaproteobacteria bacterium]|nr:DUF3971 domain-containing protein [Gammaproteobacteria bacterium]